MKTSDCNVKASEKFLSAVKFYLESLQRTGRSPKTIANYATRLRLFHEWWTKDTEPEADPTFCTFQDYAEYLKDMGKSPATIRQYLVELRCFYEYVSDHTLGEMQFYESNPVSKRLFPDTRRQNARPYEMFLTDEQVTKLWTNKKIGRQIGGNWARNYAIVTLLLSTEIRNAELLDLTPADIDFENSELVVERGKGNKYRIVDIPPIANTAIRLYLRSGVRPAYCTNSDPLFGTESSHEFQTNPNEKTERWHRGTAQWLSDLVRRHVLLVTGVDNISSHDLRHVGARLDLNNGMSLEELQARLGHSSPLTTQIYAGKLGARRQRSAARETYSERDNAARANQTLLEAFS